jgi:hypothetical protein
MPRVVVLVLVLVLLLTRVAAAQIVNAQSALASPPKSNGAVASIEGKLDWRDGNNSLLDTGAAATVVVRHDRALLLAVARAGYAESRDQVITKKTFEHVRARIKLDTRWRWELFGQHEYDQFRRISLRAVAGTGPALAVIDRAGGGAIVGLAVMFDYERLDNRAGTIDAGRRYGVFRASAYLAGHEQLAANASLVQTVYVQPRFDDASAIRVLGELTLLTKLTTRVALTNGFTISYDATPPAHIKHHDAELKVGAVVSF